MPTVNKTILIGVLTHEPEHRVTPKGTPICQFSLALNREYKTESGERKEEVCYVDIEAWGKQAETITKYVKKGQPLYVEGRLKLSVWDDKATGAKRSKISVVCENFQFLAKPEGAPAPQSQTPPERHAPPPRPKPTSTDNLDEDVPF